MLSMDGSFEAVMESDGQDQLRWIEGERLILGLLRLS
jgi:hypothetical protein